MRWRTFPIELILLAFLGLFLVYPLVYVLPGAISDEAYQVNLQDLGKSDQQKAEVAAVLFQQDPEFFTKAQALRLPYTIKEFPQRGSADQLAGNLRKAGATADVVPRRQWTLFYFKEALGFHFEEINRFPYRRLIPNAPFLWECLRNSVKVAVLTTLATTLVCLPLALWFTRYKFRGQSILAGLLLVPLILPPFVGGLGLERFLNRFGSLNLWLMELGLLNPGDPIDWLGHGGLAGVVVMQVLHLYPILYLTLAATLAGVDPALEDAARNLGAGEFRVFRTVTSPLLLPGYFAGATLVFVWAFTDLGTPLVFNVRAVIPVQIFDQVSDPGRTNSMAYALVVITLVVTALLFYSARWVVHRNAYLGGGGKGAMAATIPQAGRRLTLLIFVFVLGLTFLAVLPSFGVILTAFARRWVFTPLPESYTTAFWNEVWSNHLSSLSIRNSLSYSAVSTLLDLVIGVTLAWLIARRSSWLTSLLDGLATLPLALPGLVLAFGYLTCYSRWNAGRLGMYLDPNQNPLLLLILAYTVRRLPYLTRSALAGLQQTPPALEEAAENLGAGRWRVLRTVTLPLILPQVIAGAVLTFAFAVLEVSDSLMLAREERFYPITRAILALLTRPNDADSLASALAVFAMGFLVLGLAVSSLVMGRKMGQLFRA